MQDARTVHVHAHVYAHIHEAYSKTGKGEL
jgi:hypothetical protein